jgi:signal transduction histidine kinase
MIHPVPMQFASSLTNRIFAGSTVLATLSLALLFYFVNARVSAEAEADLRRSLEESATLVGVRWQSLTETFTTMARLVADLPKLKAAAETGHPPTVQPLADEYRAQIDADLLVVFDARGRVLGASGVDVATLRSVGGAPGAEERTTFVAHPRGILQVISVPILIGPEPVEIFGRLAVGFFMDDASARRFRELTGSEIAFAVNGRIVAASLPREARPALVRALGAARADFEAGGTGPNAALQDGAARLVRLGDEEYLAARLPMTAGDDARGDRPVAFVLRSRTERLRFLNTLRAGLAGSLIVTVLLATGLSYAVARTMTRPLRAVTSAMRDVAATGDLTRRVPVRSGAWDDEDARLLASAFNTLTESIARFQREAAQRDRLSSLGRLSTVIAHEIRNPLMIIRASLATLRRPTLSAAELREAIADIDDETMRLNRIVTEVLDFARPIRFDLAEADVNEICRASAAAAWADDPEARVALDLDPALPRFVTDRERLRTALVNIMTNARQAVQGARRTGSRPDGTVGADVIVRSRLADGRAVITVRDRGAGIAPEDLAHVFDPYFTTRRTGTGLGLPIAKNIVEGLGGAISVVSEPGAGTEIRVELPLTLRAERRPERGTVDGAREAVG